MRGGEGRRDGGGGEGNFVAIAGYSTCSYGPLDRPALWSARVRDGLVSEWRVYEDTPENRGKIGLE